MNRARTRHRAGTTLIELIVVLAILGIGFAIVGTSISQTVLEAPTLHAHVVAARRIAIERNERQEVLVRSGDRTLVISVMSDGSVIADSSLHIDRWTGSVR